ncbi:MAG: hypothetical protein ACE5IC_07500 [Candidatus Brocadiales bacterium]
MNKAEARGTVLGIFLFLSAIATHVLSGIGYYMLYGVPAVVISSFLPGIGWWVFLALWLNSWDRLGSLWVFWSFVGCFACVVICGSIIGMQWIIESTKQEIIEKSKQNMDLEPSTAG